MPVTKTRITSTVRSCLYLVAILAAIVGIGLHWEMPVAPDVAARHSADPPPTDQPIIQQGRPTNELSGSIGKDVIVIPVQSQGESPARGASFRKGNGCGDDSPPQEGPWQDPQPVEAAEGREPHEPSTPPDPCTCIARGHRLQVTYCIAILDDVNGRSPEDKGQVLTTIRAGEHAAASPWPQPDTLLTAADHLASATAIGGWQYDLATLLEELRSLPSLSDPQAPQILASMRSLAHQLDSLIIANSMTPVTSAEKAQGVCSDELRRLQYALNSRTDLWYAVHQLAEARIENIGDMSHDDYLPAVLQVGDRWLPNLADSWRVHLGFDVLQRSWFEEPRQPAAVRQAARHVLARLSSPVLNAQQNEYLRDAVPPQVVHWLIAHARCDYDLQALLAHVESYHDAHQGYYAARISDEFQNLLWHEHSDCRGLAQTIETHLRGANLRISASDQFLNLLVPEMPDVEEPVRENIMGAQVSGRSRIANRLQVRLLPDPDKINLRLDAFGLVRSSTQASRGGFIVDNLGTTRFQASKPLAIGRNGLASGPPQAMADSENQVVGMRSHFDGIPLISALARRMAHQQINSQKHAAQQTMNERVERTVKDRLNLEVEGQLDDMRSFFYSHVIEPLIALDLEPLAIETRTTHDRLIMQYRLAGIDQLAATSPRPGGLQSSLLAVQVHQSAVNNLFQRLELSGRVMTPEELTAHLSDVFGIQFTSNAPEAGIEARMEFASYDPIAVAFEDEMIAIKLNLLQLQVGRGKVWKRISVTSRYKPRAQGTRLILEQEPSGIRLEGNQFNGRDSLAIRGIFNAIFQTRYELHLIPESLEQRMGKPLDVSQLEIVDGWLAISLDALPREAQRIQHPVRVGLLDRP